MKTLVSGMQMDYDGSWQFFNADLVKARKPHTCCACRNMIAPGETYERSAGKFDGYFHSYRTCLTCVRIRTEFAGPMGPELRGHVYESFDIEFMAVHSMYAHISPDGTYTS